MSSSVSLSWPPAASTRSPCAPVGWQRSCRSLATRCRRFDAEIVLARTLKLKRSESSTTFCRGRSSHDERRRLVVAAVIASVNGSLPGQAELVLPAELSLRESSIVAARHRAPRHRRPMPAGRRSAAVDSSRLAVVVNLAVLPMTSETAPPRTSLCSGSGRPDTPAACTSAVDGRSARAAASARCRLAVARRRC